MRKRIQIQEQDEFWAGSRALASSVWLPAVQLDDAGALVSEGLADINSIFGRWKNGK